MDSFLSLLQFADGLFPAGAYKCAMRRELKNFFEPI